MEAEKNSIASEREVVEQEKRGLRDDLIRVQQEKIDVETEKAGITSTQHTFRFIYEILVHDKGRGKW